MKVSAFWIVVAIIITWHLAKAHTRAKQKRGTKAGKLLSFAGGKAGSIAGSTAAIESRPIPQGEDLPTAI
jgi:hypothetical protein